MAREAFNSIWANNPDPAQFEEPPAGTFESGWEGGPAAAPPEAKWENWWHNRVDAALQELERLGFLNYDADAVYSAGAIARGSDGAPYRSQQDNNQGNDPTTDGGTYWVREPSGIATAAEAQAFSSLSKVMTPGRMNDAFKGGNQSLGPDGYQIMPGGLIFQWGSASSPAGGSGVESSLPIPFPNNAYRVIACDNDDNTPQAVGVGFVGLDKVRVQSSDTGVVNYIAIGD